MGTEIERKFLVVGDSWRDLGKGSAYCQGYIASSQEKTVRVRIVGEQGFLTIKGATQGIARSEFEYPIPVQDAQEMLETLCDRPFIKKIRYKVEWNGLLWEIDEFEGENAGLILAEVELTDADQAINLPEWIGADVSHDPRYYNANLARFPFSQWNR
ncbi:MAG: CYTH domain-containing protein [Oscillatoriales cyanobacterium C42_A2020_001]|nr:CYTH domain-containing protein [Leptolyngbyaceae cyanobacterium C42_A2020_001]